MLLEAHGWRRASERGEGGGWRGEGGGRAATTCVKPDAVRELALGKKKGLVFSVYLLVSGSQFRVASTQRVRPARQVRVSSRRCDARLLFFPRARMTYRRSRSGAAGLDVVDARASYLGLSEI